MLWLRRVLWLLLALVVFYGFARAYVVYTESRIAGNRSPYIQMQASDGITISWHTDKPETGVVRYGMRPGALDSRVEDTAEVNAHELRLTGLKPASRYYYSAGSRQSVRYGGSEADWFMTAPEAGSTDSVRLWVIGDSGNPGPLQQSVRDAMNAWVSENPRPGRPFIDLWLMLGDNAYRSGSNAQYQLAVFDAYPVVLRNINLWPVYGNHDSRRRSFFNIFALPSRGEAGGKGSGTEHYYSFDYANIHFVILDSEGSDLAPDGDMVAWLKDDLAASQQTWLIAAFHHPPYSKGSHDSDNNGDSGGRLVDVRENIIPVLERYGVDLVLSGHSHSYERSSLVDCHYQDSSQFTERNVVSEGFNRQHQHYLKPKEKKSHSGAVYVVAGASSSVANAPLDHPVMAVSMMEAGSLIIDIEGDDLTSRYINSDALVVDQFTIKKLPGYKSLYTGCKR